MAEARRPAKYAKLALGLTETTDNSKLKLLTDKALEESSDFKYFVLFLKKKEPVLTEELKSSRPGYYQTNCGRTRDIKSCWRKWGGSRNT